MIEQTTNYKYKLVHPIAPVYLEINIWDEKSYKDWKPYLDAIDSWLLNQRIDNKYNELLAGVA